MTTTNSTTEAGVTEALKLALAYVRWQAFGECRTADHDGPMPTAAEVDTALVAAIAQSRQPSAQGGDSVPDDVWEALQRLIENSGSLGPASEADALLVAKHRRFLMTSTATNASKAAATSAKNNS